MSEYLQFWLAKHLIEWAGVLLIVIVLIIFAALSNSKEQRP